MARVITEKDLPPPPASVSAKHWRERQAILHAQGVPYDMIFRIKRLRQMNLWIWLICIMGHPYKWVADNEHILIDPKFKRDPGQA
jgi:hypothetical protein